MQPLPGERPRGSGPGATPCSRPDQRRGGSTSAVWLLRAGDPGLPPSAEAVHRPRLPSPPPAMTAAVPSAAVHTDHLVPVISPHTTRPPSSRGSWPGSPRGRQRESLGWTSSSWPTADGRHWQVARRAGRRCGCCPSPERQAGRPPGGRPAATSIPRIYIDADIEIGLAISRRWSGSCRAGHPGRPGRTSPAMARASVAGPWYYDVWTAAEVQPGCSGGALLRSAKRVTAGWPPAGVAGDDLASSLSFDRAERPSRRGPGRDQVHGPPPTPAAGDARSPGPKDREEARSSACNAGRPATRR